MHPHLKADGKDRREGRRRDIFFIGESNPQTQEKVRGLSIAQDETQLHFTILEGLAAGGSLRRTQRLSREKPICDTENMVLPRQQTETEEENTDLGWFGY